MSLLNYPLSVPKTIMVKAAAFVAIAVSLLAVSVLFVTPIQAHDVIPKNAKEVRPLLPGQMIPKITLSDATGQAISLKKHLKNQPALLIFYRGGWCPYCNRHLADLRKIEKSLIDLGFKIYAISPDLPEYLAETEKENKLNYTLLSDSKAEAAKAFGIAFEVNKVTRVKYKAFNIDLEKSSGEKHHLLPVPAAFLVDAKGKISFSFVSPDYKVRVDNDVILAAAKSQLK